MSVYIVLHKRRHQTYGGNSVNSQQNLSIFSPSDSRVNSQQSIHYRSHHILYMYASLHYLVEH